MGRKIYCSECKAYCGDIEKANIRKDISYLCGKCESARKLMKSARDSQPSSTGNMFGDIFGGMF